MTLSRTPGGSPRPWPTRALLRRPSPAYAPTYARRGVGVDQALAEQQHGAYQAALRACGLQTLSLPPEPAYFDSVFIEDAAVVWGTRAMITRMTPAREGEQAAVEEALAGAHEIMRLPEGATLEGGDVLHTEEVTFVGLSSRTNEAGAAALEAFLGEAGRRVQRAPVERCLHLKTGATWLGDRTILIAPSLIDPGAFAGFDRVEVGDDEAGGANAIRLERAVLVAEGRPRVMRAVRQFCGARDLRLVPLAISEFEKGDGSLSCLSILW